MALIGAISTQTGVDAHYHRIVRVLFDLDAGTATALIHSYLNRAARDSGAHHLAHTNWVTALDDLDDGAGSGVRDVYRALKAAWLPTVADLHDG